MIENKIVKGLYKLYINYFISEFIKKNNYKNLLKMII